MNDRNSAVDHMVKNIVGVITELRSKGSAQDVQLGYLKGKLFDAEFVDPAQRPHLLKLVNKGLGTNWSMNNVKRADLSLSEQGDAVLIQVDTKHVIVDELHGSVNLGGTGPQEASFIEKAPAITGDAQAAIEQSQATAAPADTASQAAPAAAVQQQTQTTSADKDNTMKNSNANTATNNTNENLAQGTTEQVEFLMGCQMVGRNTAELRCIAWQGFLGNVVGQPHAEAFNEFSKASDSQDTDTIIFNFCDQNSEVGKQFMGWMMINPVTAATDAEVAAMSKSRFSIMGDRDEGIRTSWVAAGAAVVGGGLEMTARGGLTLGAGLGTVVGGVAAFFAGEQVDQHVEGQFGRYVAGGVIGMGLGALGAAAGRAMLPGKAVSGFGGGDTVPEIGGQPVPALPAGAVNFSVQL
jgi:hypothetical protein